MRVTTKLKPETINQLRHYLNEIMPKTDIIQFDSEDLSLLIKKGINGYMIGIESNNVKFFDSVTGYNMVEIEIDTISNEIVIYATTYPITKPVNVKVWITDYMYIGYEIQIE